MGFNFKLNLWILGFHAVKESSILRQGMMVILCSFGVLKRKNFPKFLRPKRFMQVNMLLRTWVATLQVS